MGLINGNGAQTEVMAMPSGEAAPAAKKISLNFRRLPGEMLAGIGNATLGAEAVKPYVHAPEWQMPGTLPELKREISRTKAFLNDPDYQRRLAEASGSAEKLKKQCETLADEIEALDKKFTLGGFFGKRKDVSLRKKELEEMLGQLAVVSEDEQTMRKAHDIAFKRLEKMDEMACQLEGRPVKPRKPKGFKL